LVAVLLATAAFTFLLVPTTVAAPPPNDARSAPQALGALPAVVRGNLVGATLEADEPISACGPIKNSVWYAFRVGAARGVLTALDAAGDMDAIVEIFVRERSQLSPVACQTTNRRGQATADFDAAPDTDYVIRVAALANSVVDDFTLRVVVPDEPAQPPGRPLAGAGISAAVDRFANPDDAWSVRLRARRTYRLNFVTNGSGCAQVELYPAGTSSFGAGEPLRALRCDAHTVFTPAVSGRYPILVRAPRASRDRLHYRLRVGAAGSDDTAPGLPLANDDRVSGSLQGAELDALDLYRFGLGRRSDVRLRLRTGAGFDVVLLDDSGHKLSCACGFAGNKQLERRLRPGHYFVAVRARDGAGGGYVLSRLARDITRSRMLVGDSTTATLSPGATARLSLRVTPAVDGRASLLVERHDPLSGWLFAALLRPRVSAGVASVDFQPPSVGRWRVTGTFDGTRTASPSEGGTARFRVEEPLAP
jgi:hypothetical protein